MEVAFARLPRWLRVAFVAAMVVLAGASGLYAYRHLTQPVTLTVAVGSYDGDAARIMSAIASELASTKSPVRLKVLDKGSAPEAVKAFSGAKQIWRSCEVISGFVGRADRRSADDGLCCWLRHPAARSTASRRSRARPLALSPQCNPKVMMC